MHTLKYYIFKYNKIIHILFSIIIYFIFNSYTVFCDEEIIENNNNTVYTYLYYTSIFLITTIFIYSFAITIYPEFDYFNLLNSTNTNITPNYGLQTGINYPDTNVSIHYIDPVIHEHLCRSLEKVVTLNNLIIEQNKILLEENFRFRQQLEDILNMFDFKAYMHNNTSFLNTETNNVSKLLLTTGTHTSSE